MKCEVLACVCNLKWFFLFWIKEERVQDLVGYWVNVSLLKRIFHMNTLFTWERDRCLGKKAHLELKVTFPLNPCIFMSFCIRDREQMSFHRGQILSLLHTYRNQPTARPPAEGLKRLQYCHHWKWQEGKTGVLHRGLFTDVESNWARQHRNMSL